MISIVLPVYNAEKTVGKCIESILSQTYNDFELIIVDDGSKDGSLKICSRYKNDTRIHIAHKDNNGVSSARNHGIDIANGEWITFIDSDDWVESGYLQSLITSAFDADLVVSTFNNEKEIPISSTSREVNKEQINLFLQSKLSMSPWAKLFRKATIDKYTLRFDPNLSSGEDTVFVWNYTAYCKTVNIIDAGFYIFSGIWGDTKKYRLPIDKISYLIKKECEALSNVKSMWRLDTLDMNLAWSIHYLDGLYSNYTDIDIYELYCRLIQPIDKKTYFNNLFLSQSLQGILSLKRLYASGNEEAGKELMKELSHYFTLPVSKTSLMASNKIIYFFLKNNLRIPVHMLLKLFSNYFSNK